MRSTRILQTVKIGIATTLALTCSSPTATFTPPPLPPAPPPPPPITSIRIIAPESLLVHQTALLEVRGKRTFGEVSVDSTKVAWSSSNPTIATISSAGVVTPLARGTVTITAVFGLLEATAQLKITVRLRIARVYPPTDVTSPVSDYFATAIAIGDTMQLVTQYADVNGVILGAATARSWSSSSPNVVQVDSTGRAIGLQHVAGSVQSWPCADCTVITASSDDGNAVADVFVTDVARGLPATVRFAHMAPDLGPLTFFPSQGDPVVLSFGQWIELPITSGSFSVQVDTMPVLNPGENTFNGLIRDSDYVTIIVVAFPKSPSGGDGLVTAAWSRPSAVAADSGYVRFVSGATGPAAVNYLRNVGAPMSGTAEICYFDLGSVTDYYHRAAGDFDVISSTKTYVPDTTRTTIIAPAGHKYTYVLVGDTKATLQIIPLSDP